MSDVVALLGAIATLVSAACTGAALLINSLRTSRRERPAAAAEAAELLLDAAEDGEISRGELARIRKALDKGAKR